MKPKPEEKRKNGSNIYVLRSAEKKNGNTVDVPGYRKQNRLQAKRMMGHNLSRHQEDNS